jgi:ABC-2 type transport system ATP-binding protein
MYAIRTTDLTRDFDDVRAVGQLSIDVPYGSIFGFLGPNGAGKTTTIRLLLGLLEPTDGFAEVLGFDCQTQAGMVRKNTGVLFEYSGLYERLNVEDNLEFYARIWQIPAELRTARIRELLNHFGLWGRRQQTVSKLSRGMKQKLAIARTFIHQPRLVFLDEPTAGLDPIAAANLHDDLTNFSKIEGVTIFLTTHNLAEAEKICSQVGVINAGKLLAKGTLDQLRRAQLVQHIEVIGCEFDDQLLSVLNSLPEILSVKRVRGGLLLETNEIQDTTPIVNIIIKAGGRVNEFKRVRTSLEDVFLELMQEQP